MRITRNRPDTQPGPAGHFNGTVWIDQVPTPEPPSRLRWFSVHYAPGGHTGWHTHPHGQVLHVTEGEGLVQRRGGAGRGGGGDPGRRHGMDRAGRVALARRLPAHLHD